MQASGVSSPGGSLALCYDERGREYVVPAYCYQAPEKFIRDAAAPSSAPAENASSPQKQLPKVEANSQSPAAAIAPPSGACIKLKVCVCPGDFRLVVDTSLQETVATFQQRVSDAAAMVGRWITAYILFLHQRGSSQCYVFVLLRCAISTHRFRAVLSVGSASYLWERS